MRQKTLITGLLAGLFIIFNTALAAHNAQKIDEVKVFINKFQELSHNYDKSIVEMYSDQANIIRIVEHSDGKTERVKLPVKGYKKMLRWAGFWAKLKGYKNYYKDLSYKIENENVRITGKRENNSGYKAPVSLLVGKNDKGKWKILEEKTRTKSVFLVKQVLSRIK